MISRMLQIAMLTAAVVLAMAPLAGADHEGPEIVQATHHPVDPVRGVPITVSATVNSELPLASAVLIYMPCGEGDLCGIRETVDMDIGEGAVSGSIGSFEHPWTYVTVIVRVEDTGGSRAELEFEIHFLSDGERANGGSEEASDTPGPGVAWTALACLGAALVFTRGKRKRV